MRPGQRGSSLGEQLVLLAIIVLLATVLAVTFSRSPMAALAMIGVALATALLVLTFGILREWRAARRRESLCRSAMQCAAPAQQAALDVIFCGAGQTGPAAFGIAGAARKLFYAHQDAHQTLLEVMDFGQLSAAFARQDDGQRYRLEVRARGAGDGSSRAARFLTVARRQEAERWVSALSPHLGTRAKMVGDSKDDV